ncbi:phosphomannose isomerase type II C-terminal cupin domain [Janibacter indicus]|uniref:phosphomannose isomerase type II C-terminal cupin domain n=1 Tax=Janibacter indicus TaxID=857417 RepID=UPI000933D09D|nr:phosphomannose isomerase type II C-terminal cupin domain [Janibacter indicus]
MFVSRRPWGEFQQFSLNHPTTVKVITVKPGERLSLQVHNLRAEFWQVLDGPVNVSVDEVNWVAETGDQVWIPVGATHRMGNNSDHQVRVLEIGYGHFDESDIVRLEDDYRRQ